MESAEECLTGRWRNHLGSIVVLKAEGGLLKGTYTTAVSQMHLHHHHHHHNPDAHSIHGTYQATLDGVLLSFSVQWCYTQGNGQSCRSSACWNGKLFYSCLHTFETTWLLVSDLESRDAWRNTLTNRDSFIQCLPNLSQS